MGRLTVRAAVLLAAAVLTAAACGRDEAQASGGPYARQVANATPRVERAVGLTFKTPPKVEARSKEQVREFLDRQFEESNSARELASKETVYKRFGLLPDTLDLRRLLTDLLTEQIVGFYDPDTKALYLVQGSPPEAAGVVLSHELVHALQDQYFNLDSLQDVRGEDDRVAAAQAVIEGQATVAQLGGGQVAARLPGGWDRVRQLIRETQGSMPVFAGAPMLIQETLIFPYLSGAEFVRRYEEQGGDAARLYRDLPVSTEQVLHANAYFGTRDAPTHVTLPVADDAYQNVLGEFETRLLLYQQLQDQAAAVRGAEGWDGDRYALIETPRGQTLVWLSVWDSTADAAEFFGLMDQATAKRYGAAGRAGAGGSKGYTAGGRSVQLRGGEVGGRDVVLYVDAPAGASTDGLDLAGVRLR